MPSGTSLSPQSSQTCRKAAASAAAAAGSSTCSQLLWCRYRYTVTSWIWIRPSDDGSTPMTEPYQSVRLSTRYRHKAADGGKSRISKPRVVYNPFSHREPHKVLQPTTNSQQRKNTPLSAASAAPVHLQCHLPGGREWQRRGGNSAEIVPLMKTNWRNQGSFLLPSQEANPNNMKLPKPRFSFAQKRVRIPWETTMLAKWKPSED